MAKFEEVLPALRAGKKVRRAGWGFDQHWHKDDEVEMHLDFLFHTDWEVVPKPKRVADYLCPSEQFNFVTNTRFECWLKETHEIGKQPEGAVLIPSSERTQEDGQ